MQLPEFVEIIENVAEQSGYPGYDLRTLNIGLPSQLAQAHAGLFAKALALDNVLVKLAALRWFWERPGDAKRYVEVIAKLLEDKDEWVRLEACRALGRINKVPEDICAQLAGPLADADAGVRKAAAQACGKLGHKIPVIIEALKNCAQDKDIEVRWKAEKALRKLGAYESA